MHAAGKRTAHVPRGKLPCASRRLIRAPATVWRPRTSRGLIRAPVTARRPWGVHDPPYAHPRYGMEALGRRLIRAPVTVWDVYVNAVQHHPSAACRGRRGWHSTPREGPSALWRRRARHWHQRRGRVASPMAASSYLVKKLSQLSATSFEEGKSALRWDLGAPLSVIVHPQPPTWERRQVTGRTARHRSIADHLLGIP